MRTTHKLSARAVETQKIAGYYADGGGLYLSVTSAGTKSWIFRYTLAGRSREMGLGATHTVSLAEAREKATACRKQLTDRIDPIEARNAQRASAALEGARSVTFTQCATTYIDAHKAKWSNTKHAGQWTATLEDYAGPVFGKLPVQDVDTALVLKVLEPIWTTKAETASRVRARIEAVLDWATVRGHRAGDNPARWRGHLDKLLPQMVRKGRVKHHPALPYSRIGAFTVELRAQEGSGARALEFLILSAARTGEVIGAKPPEFDLDAGVWTVPAERMKAKRQHRVPLSPRALELAKEAIALGEDYVFPGMREGAPLSNMAMLKLLERMKRDDITVHGFRSTFRDWASECTAHPHEVCEMALAHTISDQAEAAYRRGDLFEKRRLLMIAWGQYCDTPSRTDNVEPIRRAA